MGKKEDIESFASNFSTSVSELMAHVPYLRLDEATRVNTIRAIKILVDVRNEMVNAKSMSDYKKVISVRKYMERNGDDDNA